MTERSIAGLSGLLREGGDVVLVQNAAPNRLTWLRGRSGASPGELSEIAGIEQQAGADVSAVAGACVKERRPMLWGGRAAGTLTILRSGNDARDAASGRPASDIRSPAEAPSSPFE